MGPEIASAAERRRQVGLAGHTNNPSLARQYLDDPSAPVRVAALRSLERLGDLTVEEISVALGDTDPATRIAALEIAATRAQPSILASLTDANPAVVEAAAWALGERVPPDEGAVDELAAIAAGHEDPLARESAVAALGAIGDQRGLSAILGATHDKPAVRRRAVIALSAFEGPEVDDAWRRARSDHDRQVREAVEELLGLE